MNKSVRTQAKVGGEVGLNGEFYEGGQFLPSSENTEKGAAKSKKVTSTRKEEYESYKWAVAPIEGQHPIYAIMGVYMTTRNSRAILCDVVIEKAGINGIWGYTFEELATMWNNGERWVTPR